MKGQYDLAVALGAVRLAHLLAASVEDHVRMALRQHCDGVVISQSVGVLLTRRSQRLVGSLTVFP